MSDAHDPLGTPVPRRDFLRLAGLGTGALLAGGLPATAGAAAGPAPATTMGAGRARASSHVIVVGAGAWGAFTALNLRRAGHRVTLVDQYGAANSRATSGDETRGIRSSYGDRTVTPELWTDWARRSIRKWREFDAEHGRRFGTRFYYTTGDVILREKPEAFTTRTQELWTAQGVRFETLSAEEATRRWPQIASAGHQVVLYEPDAGVARSRDAVQAAVAIGRDAGVGFRIGRVTPGAVSGGRMDGVTLADGTKLTADSYVFCCGPWMEKVLPVAMKNRMRVPMGHVCYFGAPVNDERFSAPNIPSWNVPGVTGWASLPADSFGFRVRGSIAPPPPPRAAGDDDTPPPPPPPQASPDPRQQDPDLSSRWSNQERIDGSRRVLQKYFPAMADAPLLATRACHYESSVNRNFIVDHVPGADNAWIAGLGQAEGFKFSIVLGEYIAKRVTGDAGDPVIAAAFRWPEKEYEPTLPGQPRREWE
ncbi:MAG: FAD-dependent oxidoreductase [Gemmatimonadaceae bacterium]|nr:FAD-dependent oxidoreductase [Gemmatimonadaceae bacterium]